MFLLRLAPVSPLPNEPLGAGLWFSGSNSHAPLLCGELDKLKPRMHLTLILMRERVSYNSVENINDTFIVHVCFSSSSQDFDPWRIRRSGNICYTGIDEVEDDDSQAAYFTLLLVR